MIVGKQKNKGAFPIQIFPSQAKCLLYQIMEKVLISVSSQSAAEEESNEDVSADGQT